MDRLVGLQVLRGAAALSVAMHHAQHETGLFAAATGQAFLRSDILPWSAGVDVFFVISGFIMVHASQALFGRPGAARLFLARRVARIVPLYWIATSAFLVLVLMRPNLVSEAGAGPLEVAASYLFLPVTRADGIVVPVYSLGWTLNYEMFFYVLFAAALPLPRRRAVTVLCLVLAALVAAGAAAAPSSAPLAFWTAPIILEFGLGMALGHARAEGLRLPTLLRWMLVLAGIGALAAVAGTGADALAGWGRVVPALSAALLVAATGLGDGRQPARPGMRLGLILGDASYALYLLHPFATRGVRLVAEATETGRAMPPALFLVLSLAGALVLAVLVYRSVERPLTRRVRRALSA